MPQINKMSASTESSLEIQIFGTGGDGNWVPLACIYNTQLTCRLLGGSPLGFSILKVSLSLKAGFASVPRQ
jgi:hypothetical protein